MQSLARICMLFLIAMVINAMLVFVSVIQFGAAACGSFRALPRDRVRDRRQMLP